LNQIPAILHIQLSEKLKQLPDNKLQQIQESLYTLVSLLNIDEIEASPIITIEDPLQGGQDIKEPIHPKHRP
jgi:hypothetical protein